MTDDRITCRMCSNHAPEGDYCRAKKHAELASLPRRCTLFVPLPVEGDQRTGGERWPTLETSTTKAREEDFAFRVCK